jgi:pimeloyl-ACP methyl ester carboxylesterase
MNSTLETVTSADGTRIALERIGDGPPVILIGGAFNDRTTVAGLAAILAPQVTAVTYDRRGRGASGDSPAYSVQAEIDDLTAVIAYVGGVASVFGHSSGAVLALEAVAHRLPIDKLAVYEPTFVIDGSRPRPAVDLADRLHALLALGRRDDAAALFLTESVGLPSEMVEGMRASPMWGWFTGLAHTLPYDVAICSPGMVLPADRLATIRVPTLALTGSNSPEWLHASTHAVADAIPGARFVTIDGQDHGVLQQPDALRSILTEFFISEEKPDVRS